MNRQQRMAYMKSQPAYKKMSVEARAAALIKNGITVEDLKQAKNEGYQLGVESAIGTAYAGFALALEEKHRFDRQTIIDTLRCADEKIVFALSSWDLIQEVYDRIGFQIDFKDPEGRVQEVE